MGDRAVPSLISQASKARSRRGFSQNQGWAHPGASPPSAAAGACPGSAGRGQTPGPAAPAWSCDTPMSTGVCGGHREPPAHSPPTHARQCSNRTPTSSPTRLSPGGCVRCRHTASSSCPRVWNTTSCAPQLVTLSPVTCGDSWGHRCGQGCPGLRRVGTWHGQHSVAKVSW